MTIKLLKKGIKINGEYFSASYSSGKNNLKDNATIYITGHKSLPDAAYKELNIQNDSDSMSDYFEKDRIRIPAEHPLRAKIEELALR